MPADDRPQPDDDPAARALAAARARIGGSARRTGRPDGGRRRSSEPVFSGPGPDERDPQRLGGAIDRLVADSGWTPTLPVATLMGAWDRLVGPEIAAHCRPERLTDGELRVVAESTAWATQLQLMSASVLVRLREGLGGEVVRSLRVVGPAAPSWRRGPRRVNGRGPRDTYG